MATLNIFPDAIVVSDKGHGNFHPIHLDFTEQEHDLGTLFLSHDGAKELRDDLLAVLPLPVAEPKEVPDTHAEATARETDGEPGQKSELRAAAECLARTIMMPAAESKVEAVTERIIDCFAAAWEVRNA